MAKRPHEQDQDFNWETEFESEEDLRSQRPVQPHEEIWAEERPPAEASFDAPFDAPFDERLRPEHADGASERRPTEASFDAPFDERLWPEHADGAFERRPIVIWPEDDTPKMGRATRALYVAFFVVLASIPWVLERTLAGPATEGDDIQAANESSWSPAPPPSAAPGADTVAAKPLQPRLDAAAVPPANSPTTPRSTTAPPPRAASGSPAPSRSTTSAASGQRRPAPPERRLNLEPPARPPYRSIPEPTPPRPAIAESNPPARITPPTPSQVARPSPPPATTSPSPPAAAAAETTPAPLLHVAVDEPELRPAAAPPSAPATPPPTAATPEPAAAPRAAAAPPPAAVDVDSGAIRDVLGFYRTAFNELDAVAVQQVWPTVNQRTLDRAFRQLQEQNLSFDKCTIAVKRVLADANCSGTTRFVPRVGSRSAQTEQRQWSFRLRKADQGQWLIQNVEAR